MDEEYLYRKARELWGSEFQMLMLSEECSELSAEACRFIRGRENYLDLIEELADVEIMIRQIRQFFKDGTGGESEALIDATIDEKLQRLFERVRDAVSKAEDESGASDDSED